MHLRGLNTLRHFRMCVCVYIYICVSVCINPDMEKGGVVHTEMPIEAAFLVKMQKS